MKLKITKHTEPKAWYRNNIGDYFDILEESKDVDGNKVYITHKGRMVNSFVDARDCDVIEIAKEGDIIEWELDDSHAEGFRGPHQAKVAAIGDDHYCVYSKYGPDMIPFTSAKIIK